MSDLEQDQDQDVAQPGIRLRVFLAMMRIISGRRGHARFIWSGQGFVYDLHVVRQSAVPRELDFDPTAIGLDEAREILDDAV